MLKRILGAIKKSDWLLLCTAMMVLFSLVYELMGRVDMATLDMTRAVMFMMIYVFVKLEGGE